jgi:hypothetical protein
MLRFDGTSAPVRFDVAFDSSCMGFLFSLPLLTMLCSIKCALFLGGNRSL